MFFCKECGEENGWPESVVRSRGPCEICGRTAVCYERKIMAGEAG